MSDKAMWTPTPWHVYERCETVICDAQGSSIGDITMGSPIRNGWTESANTARIVECVNACATIDRPGTQIPALQKLASERKAKGRINRRFDVVGTMTAVLTDLKIVLACARAMELDIRTEFDMPHIPCEQWHLRDTSDEKGSLKLYWPLTDKEQAMDLVITMKLQIEAIQIGRWSVFGMELMTNNGDYYGAHDGDLLRAICLCAAKIQLSKEQK